MSGEGFLHRWSRLKRGGGVPDPARDARCETDGIPDAAMPHEAQGARPAPPPVPPPGLPAELGGDTGGTARDAASRDTAPRDAGSPAATPAAAGRGAGAPVPLPPIESLRPDSDFSPFMQAGVDPAIRNAALARLFADPRFNVMDGLDVYIDDYGKTEPIPPAILRGLEQARTLGLFDEPGQGEAAGPAEASVASACASPAAGRDACGAALPQEPSQPEASRTERSPSPPAPRTAASPQQERENPET